MRLLAFNFDETNEKNQALLDLIEDVVGLTLDFTRVTDLSDRKALRRTHGLILVNLSDQVAQVTDLPDKPLLVVGNVQPQADSQPILILPDDTDTAQLMAVLQSFIRHVADFNAEHGRKDYFPTFRTGLREVDAVSGASEEI